MAKKDKKEYTLDRKKFLTFIGVVVVVIASIIVMISCNKKLEITEGTDISKLNAEKYYDEIKSEYDKSENKVRFFNEYNNIQNAIGEYIINNFTTDNSSFQNIIIKINDELEKNNFERFGIGIPTFWNGKWSVDERGNLKFKFKTKRIEPIWIDDNEVMELFIKND